MNTVPLKIKTIKFLITILISILLFSSCAIHKKFPFICFRSGCVKVAFGVYQIKAWKKNRQGKAQMRRNKANAKASLKSKKDKTGRTSDPGYNENDTLSYVGSANSCDNIKMVFYKQAKIKRDQTDTLIIGFRQPENEISEVDEVQIRGYLYKNNKDHLIKIKLCDCNQNLKQNELTRGSYLQRATKITKYLKEKKIPKRKIELE